MFPTHRIHRSTSSNTHHSRRNEREVKATQTIRIWPSRPRSVPPSHSDTIDDQHLHWSRGPPSSMLRFYMCKDSSNIVLNLEGYQVHYHANTHGPPTPFCGNTERTYLSGDGSSIILSRDGWIEYHDGVGFRCSMSSKSLHWQRHEDGVTWVAWAPVADRNR